MMVTFLSLLWFFISISFIVMFIITIIKIIRKSRICNSLIGTLTLFILGLICFIIIGIIVTNETNEEDQTKNANNKTTISKDKENKDKKSEKKSEHKGESNRAKEENNSKRDTRIADKENKADNKRNPGTTDKIPVELSSTVDGDTAKFVYKGKPESFRFLLIDTPETKHPKIGKQPFGQEASNRTAELLNNATKIEVEFDVGQKQDKYNRKLAYIYVDGKMLNNILVREGLAKVAYIYPPNTRHLDKLEIAQQKAKAEKIGIWSLKSTFEENTQPDTSNSSNYSNSLQNENKSIQSNNNLPEQAIQSFSNCTQLRKSFPNGVPKGHASYSAKLDRDKDGFACEVY
jgi:micrococcal nuclease